MTEAIIAQKSPYEIELKAGKSYAWCACGRSEKQPFCDGSHSGTGLMPVVWKAEKDETAWLCGCKQTGEKPNCDGTHNSL
jgi:CDGSH-type Zn-finger protein